jgi:hypothetical protein
MLVRKSASSEVEGGPMKGPKQSYATMMDRAVLDEQALIESKGMAYPLRPSASGECARKLAYELAAYEGILPRIKEEWAPQLLRLFRLGHHIEEQVLNDLKKVPGTSVRFQQQMVEMFTLPSGRIIEGSTDAVMFNEDSRCLLDVKSVGDKFSSWRSSKWSEMVWQYDHMRSLTRFDGDARDEKGSHAWWTDDVLKLIDELGEDTLVKNIIQLNLYACTDFLQKRGVDHVTVLRYQKNASKLMEVRFAPSMELFNRTKKKFTVIEEAVTEAKLLATEEERIAHINTRVSKGFILGSLACAYCPYRDRCWANAKRSDHFKNMPPKDWAVKVEQLEHADHVRDLLEKFSATDAAIAERKSLEQQLLVQLDGHGVEKVKLPSGEVFEIKRLSKSIELRRGKE